MVLSKTEDGKYIIPDDYKGNIELLKLGYPSGSEFVFEKDIKKDDDDVGKNPKDVDKIPDDIVNFLKKNNINDVEQLAKLLSEQKGSGSNQNRMENTDMTGGDYIDEDLIKESILRKKAPEKYSTYMRLKYGNISDEDVIALGLMEENPDIFKDINEARSYVMKRYGDLTINVDEDEDAYDEEELKEKKLQAELENKERLLQRRKIAKELKSSILNSIESLVDKDEMSKYKQSKNQPNEQEIKAKVEKWKPVFDNNILKETEVKITEDFSFPLDEEAKKIFGTAAADYVLRFLPENNDENINTIKEYAANAVIISRLNDILKSYAEYIRNMTDKEWNTLIARRYFNSSKFERTTGKSTQTSKPGGADKYLSDLERRTRGR